MKFDWAIERLQDMLDEADQSFDIDALELAIKSIEAWEKVKEEIIGISENPDYMPTGTYDYVKGSEDCRKVVLEIIHKHLIEGTTLEIEEQYLGGGRHDD